MFRPMLDSDTWEEILVPETKYCRRIDRLCGDRTWKGSGRCENCRRDECGLREAETRGQAPALPHTCRGNWLI